MAEELRPCSTISYKSPAPPIAWAEPDFTGRLGFLVPANDQAIPKAAQEGMMMGSGQEWLTREIQCTHNAPFHTKKEQAVKLIEELIQLWS